MKTQLTQKKKLRDSGSFFNWLMSNNASVPVEGEWATICFWSDRDVCKVVEVSKDGKTVVIEDYDTKASKIGREIGMGHQNWEHSPTGHLRTLVYRHGAWRVKSQERTFNKNWYEIYEKSDINWFDYIADIKDQLWQEDGDLALIDGVTRVKTTYEKINIIFGRCDYHYDWTF
jgi:hypothetical protein